MFLAAGILIGAFVAWHWLFDHDSITLNPGLVAELSTYGISDSKQIVPHEIVNWSGLLTLKGILFTVVGGFLVGFGTRYAGGCTSGHAISGLSNLQWPSLVATISFMAGGFFIANVVLPSILKL